MKTVKVHVPATSANLGPGFDVLGVALRLYNDVSLTAEDDAWVHQRPTHAVSVDVEGEGLVALPRDESNLVAKAAYRVFEQDKRWPKRLLIKLVNRIPLARGLGSSAAATIGGLVAANRLAGKPLSDQELLDLAVEMEGHPDNVVPALVGGFCISGRLDGGAKYLKFNSPLGLQAVVCVPEKSLPTAESRRVLPSRIPLNAAVFTSSRVAFLIGAVLQKKYAWLSFAMDDVLHQPTRARLVPGLNDVIRDAKKAGAYGAALSGAGSSVIALCRPGPIGKRVAHAMEKAFAGRNLRSRAQVLSLDNRGSRIA